MVAALGFELHDIVMKTFLHAREPVFKALLELSAALAEGFGVLHKIAALYTQTLEFFADLNAAGIAKAGIKNIGGETSWVGRGSRPRE